LVRYFVESFKTYAFFLTIYSGQNHEKNSGISSFKRKKLLPDQKGTWGGPFFWQGVAWYLAFTIKGKRMVEDAIII